VFITKTAVVGAGEVGRRKAILVKLGFSRSGARWRAPKKMAEENGRWEGKKPARRFLELREMSWVADGTQKLVLIDNTSLVCRKCSCHCTPFGGNNYANSKRARRFHDHEEKCRPEKERARREAAPETPQPHPQPQQGGEGNKQNGENAGDAFFAE
jgi:hypothetical protein